MIAAPGGLAGNETDFCDGASCDATFAIDISGAEAILLPRNADGSLPSQR